MIELINHLNTDLAKARLLELRHVFNEAPEYKANIEQEMGKLQAEMNRIKDQYSQLSDTRKSSAFIKPCRISEPTMCSRRKAKFSELRSVACSEVKAARYGLVRGRAGGVG